MSDYIFGVVNNKDEKAQAISAFTALISNYMSDDTVRNAYAINIEINYDALFLKLQSYEVNNDDTVCVMNADTLQKVVELYESCDYTVTLHPIK